jgi:hypothetical protein
MQHTAELSGQASLVALLSGLQQKFPDGKLVVWTMQSCNSRQAVMSALEALVLAGKGLVAVGFLLVL